MTFALIYHDLAAAGELDDVGFPGPLAARYKLAPDRFEAHLDAIEATGARVGTVDADGPAPEVALTFDDGGASAPAAAETLERRGWRGHFFVTTGRIGTPGFLSAAGVAELAARGHVVGSHSHSHPTYMGRLPATEIAREWRDSREHLGELLGTAPLCASVPGGFLSRDVVRCAAEAGYRLLMTSEPSARVRSAGGMTVLGRYTIWATTPPGQAAAYASGRRGARARLWLEWQAKGLAKRASPGAYQALRRARAGLR